MNLQQGIETEKTKLLNDLLNAYKQEITAIYAIAATWEQLKEEAKDKCAEDFDKALVARETLLEELGELKDAGVKHEQYDISLFTIDQILLAQSGFVKEIYGLDVNAYLNVKTAKALPKSK